MYTCLIFNWEILLKPRIEIEQLFQKITNPDTPITVTFQVPISSVSKQY